MRNSNRIIVFVFLLYTFILTPVLFAFEEIITVPAENPQGVELDFKKGGYTVKIAGGAMTLFYPINPNYHWLIGAAIGTDTAGYQDEPNIGTLYFEPNIPVHSQAEAEQQAIKAAEEKAAGTSLSFTLTEDKKIRFWVSDFDYTDNTGMVKLKIQKIN